MELQTYCLNSGNPVNLMKPFFSRFIKNLDSLSYRGSTFSPNCFLKSCAICSTVFLPSMSIQRKLPISSRLTLKLGFFRRGRRCFFKKGLLYFGFKRVILPSGSFIQSIVRTGINSRRLISVRIFFLFFKVNAESIIWTFIQWIRFFLHIHLIQPSSYRGNRSR